MTDGLMELDADEIDRVSGGDAAATRTSKQNSWGENIEPGGPSFENLLGCMIGSVEACFNW